MCCFKLIRNWRMSSPYHIIQYRTLQMLSNFQNLVFAPPSMAVFVGAITLCESSILYLLVTSGNIVPFPVFVLFSIAAVDYLIIMLGIFKIISNPYVKSVKFLKLLGIKKVGKWEVRFIKSCPPSKIMLGNGKFFDQLTSIIIWQKCVDFLITLLLL